MKNAFTFAHPHHMNMNMIKVSFYEIEIKNINLMYKNLSNSILNKVSVFRSVLSDQPKHKTSLLTLNMWNLSSIVRKTTYEHFNTR